MSPSRRRTRQQTRGALDAERAEGLLDQKVKVGLPGVLPITPLKPRMVRPKWASQLTHRWHKEVAKVGPGRVVALGLVRSGPDGIDRSDLLRHMVTQTMKYVVERGECLDFRRGTERHVDDSATTLKTYS